MTLSIKDKADWGLIRKQNQMQKNKDNTRKNKIRGDHEYKVSDKVILKNKSAHKYDTSYIGPFEITQCWANVTATLQISAKKKIQYTFH